MYCFLTLLFLITALCKAIGVDLSNTVSFGDAENDVELLVTAHLGVAMRNSRYKALKVRWRLRLSLLLFSFFKKNKLSLRESTRKGGRNDEQPPSNRLEIMHSFNVPLSLFVELVIVLFWVNGFPRRLLYLLIFFMQLQMSQYVSDFTNNENAVAFEVRKLLKILPTPNRG